MSKLLTPPTPDWQNPLVLQRNRQPAHASLLPYLDEASALTAERGATPFFTLLNGALAVPLPERPPRGSRRL